MITISDYNETERLPLNVEPSSELYRANSDSVASYVLQINSRSEGYVEQR